VPADPNEPIQEATPGAELLRDLADIAARYRGDSAEGTLADLLAVLAGPETDLLQRLRDRFPNRADTLALDAVRDSFEGDQKAFLGRLLRRYPGLFHSQGAD
jgi:hypothetical protein